jgi:hypothetical protein
MLVVNLEMLANSAAFLNPRAEQAVASTHGKIMSNLSLVQSSNNMYPSKTLNPKPHKLVSDFQFVRCI